MMSELPYSTIIVSGDDAFDFLQAQLAADLSPLGGNASLSSVHPDQQQGGVTGYPILSAWCNPKGRVICLLRVARIAQDYSLILPIELTDEVVKRLTMFRFRAKVDFTILPATSEQLGIEGSLDDWRLANLRGGIPEIRQPQSEHFTPHMLNLDLLGAVSVDKGCYPGQEIVARTHFRGATKRRCMRFESKDPVAPGDKVSDGERDVGEVLNAIGIDLLAVVPVEMADKPLFVGETELLHLALPY
jgi:folate-binding protein YgfZ